MTLIRGRRIIATALSLVVFACSVATPHSAVNAQARNRVSPYEVTTTDEDLVALWRQIKDLNDPTFRAFLRVNVLNWFAQKKNPERLQLAVVMVSDGLSDLCAHEDGIWPPTAAWLRNDLIKTLRDWSQSDAEVVAQKCLLKGDADSTTATKDLASGLSMLNNPETAGRGLELAKQAIASGQIPPPALLGELLRLQQKGTEQLVDLLFVVVALEESQPGSIPLQLFPFFGNVFFRNTNPPELQLRFLAVALRATRLDTATLQANQVARSQVVTLLKSILPRIVTLAPGLYSEAAGRLAALDPNALNSDTVRREAEDRIAKSSDPLQATIEEADQTSDQAFRKQLLQRAARLAVNQGQLHKAIDLFTKATEDETDKPANDYSPRDEFLKEVVMIALKKKDYGNAGYAVAKMNLALNRAVGLRATASDYSSANQPTKARDALAEAAKDLDRAEISVASIRVSLGIAEDSLRLEPDQAAEALQRAIKMMQRLSKPEDAKDKMFYLSLLPLAKDLVRVFATFGSKNRPNALAFAQSIRTPELRVAAITGVYRPSSLANEVP